MIKFSIIVPVYNTGNYLIKCLDSILLQNYNNFEIIIVNDGSTDNSDDIIKSYVKKDNRIKYYNKKNGGLSDARNYGIEKAKGEFLIFVDSDDFLANDLLFNINSNINKETDIIRYQIQEIVDGKGIKLNEFSFEDLTGEEAFKIIVNYKIIDSACCYCFKTNFWKSNNFIFPINKYHEDFGIIPFTIIKAKKVTSINYIGYNYVHRKDSIMTSNDYEKTKKKVYDMIYHFDNLYYLVNNDIKISYNIKKVFNSYIANSLIVKGRELNNNDLKIYKKELIKRNIFNLILNDTFLRRVKKLIIKINYKFYLRKIVER